MNALNRKTNMKRNVPRKGFLKNGKKLEIVFDKEKKVMTCTDFVSFYRDKVNVDDHETFKSHQKAHDFIVGKQKSDQYEIS